MPSLFRKSVSQTRAYVTCITLHFIQDSDKWNERALTILEQHLSKGINADGFQFERTIIT
jgi:hypothetical protein